MSFIADNWYILIAGIAAIAVAVFIICKYFRLPRTEQITKIKEWLLFAVTEAERELGSGTGQLKLRYVYDMFVAKFPYLVKFVSFEYFSELVDEVLVKFREILSKNKAIKQYVTDPTLIEHKETV